MTTRTEGVASPSFLVGPSKAAQFSPFSKDARHVFLWRESGLADQSSRNQIPLRDEQGLASVSADVSSLYSTRTRPTCLASLECLKQRLLGEGFELAPCHNFRWRFGPLSPCLWTYRTNPVVILHLPSCVSRSTLQLGTTALASPYIRALGYQYEKPLEELIRDSSEGGRNVRLHRNGVISLTYALWEEKYRAIVAKECGLACKNEVRSDVFHDLNKYRQAILKRGARLDRGPTKMRFFAKDDEVSFTKDQMHDLFAQLIEELNRIGEEYYGQNPGFTLDRPLH